MPTTVTMPTPIFLCMIAIVLWVIIRDDVKPLLAKVFKRKVNGVVIDFKIKKRSAVSELN